jgi:amino acid adenylation domain-containing protein
MKYENLDAKIEKIAGQNPGRIAICYEDQEISYQALQEKSTAIANSLHRRLKPSQEMNMYVFIILDRSPQLIQAILAVLKCGLVFVPVDPMYPLNRIRLFLETTGAQWVITSIDYYDHLKDLFSHDKKTFNVLLVDGDSTAGNGDFSNIYPVDDGQQNDRLCFEKKYNKYAYIYFTSGSTGIPKGVLGLNRSLAHFIQWEIMEFGIDENFRVSQLTNPSFDPFLRDIFAPLAAGGTCCIPAKETLMDPVQLIRWIDRDKISLIHTVPSLFKMLQYVLLAGEMLRGSDIKKFFDVFKDKIQLVNIYGPTETTLAKLFYPIRASDVNRTIIPVGKPIRDTEVMILNEKKRKCLVGNIGEIYIRTPFSSARYMNADDLNREVFIKNPFSNNSADIIYKTGDLGRLLPCGNVELVGRLDNQVKIRGIRIELKEIEKHLLEHDGINDVIAGVRTTPGGDKYICAYVVPSCGDSPAAADCDGLDASSLRKYLLDRLPEYMVPSYFLPLDRLPLNPNGKVDRDKLSELSLPGTKIEKDYLAPRNQVEKKLQMIWAGILNLEPEQLSVNSSFFNMGGHSLNAMPMISRIHREYNIRLSLRDIFQNITIEKLARLIERGGEDEFTPLAPLEEKEYYTLSWAQKNIIFQQRLTGQGLDTRAPLMVVLEGRLDKKRLQAVFRKLIERHESFRTSFIKINGEYFQEIHRDAAFEMDYYDLVTDGTENENRLKQKEIIEHFVRAFEISRPPLLRVGLLKIKRSTHILLVDMAPVIYDGISWRILTREFSVLYAAEKELTPLKFQYRHYSEWQHREKQKELLKKQEKYWLRVFEDGVPRLNLAGDYENTTSSSPGEGRVTFAIDREKTAALKKLALAENVTPYMVFLAIYNILLSTISGQEDIVVSSPVAGRRYMDSNLIIGRFANNLPLRNRPSGQKTLKEFLQEVKQNTLSAFENQEYRLSFLVETLPGERSVGTFNPFASVRFAFQDISIPTGEIPETEITGLKMTPAEADRRESFYDLNLNGRERDAAFSFTFRYKPALFKASTIHKFVGYFNRLVSMVLECPDEKICMI